MAKSIRSNGKKFNINSSRNGSPAMARAAQFVVEALERRMLLTGTNTWSGVNADWNTAGDWSQNRVPNSTDNVVINAGTATVSTADPAEMAGTLTTAAGSTLNIPGSSLTLNGNSSIGGSLSVSGGTLNNTGQTLTLSAANSSFSLSGAGTLEGGTVTATGGTALTATGGTLNGVTLGANLTVNTAGVTVLNGLTLNNANVTLANATGYSNYTTFVFQGTQTLGGTGQIIFGGGNQISGIAAVGGNTIATAATLTIGPNITVDVNPLSNEGGDIYGNYSQDSIVNQGTINANTPGATITLNFGATSSFATGIIESTNGGNLQVNGPISVNGTGVFAGYGTGTLAFSGNLTGNTTNSLGYSPLETVLLNGNGTVSSPQTLEAMSDDLGEGATGYVDNFAYGTISIGNSNYVQLVDQSHNSTGTGAEAVYAVSVIVPSGSTLDLHGLHLYAGSTSVHGTILNGTVTLSALPPAVAAVSGNGQPIADNSTMPSTSNATSFGTVAQNTPAIDEIYTITNDGIATLTVGTVTVPVGYSVLAAPPSSVPAHASATFTVGLATANTGTFGGDVSFSTSDSANNPYSFEITGTITPAEPSIGVSYNSQAVADHSVATAVSDGTDFGTTAQGGAPVQHTFTITNFGNAILNLGVISLPAGFSLLGTPSASVAAGSSTSFTIGLATANFGTFSGGVSFSTNDPFNNPFNFAVTGTITAAPAPITSVSYNGVTIADHSTGTTTSSGTNFGFSLQGGAPVVHSFTINNTGNALLTLGTINLPARFSLVGTPATIVAPGGSATFTFGLDTSNIGTFSGNVNFSTNDANNNPFTFAVTGVVGLSSSPYIAVTPPDSQTATAGQNALFTLGSFLETNATAPYSVTVNWGDGSANTVFAMGAAGTIPAQTHTYQSSGNPTVTLSVEDSAGDSSNNATFTVDVAPAPATITVTPPATQIASPAQANYIQLGSFSATNGVGPYTLTVNWGDGSAIATYSVSSPGNLPTEPHTYANEGTNTVLLTVTDSVGHTSNSAFFSVVVASTTITLFPAATQYATVGQSEVFALGSFTQSNASGPFTAIVNWGDGSSSTFGVASAGTIPATAHTYNAAALDTPTVYVVDSANHSSNVIFFNVAVSLPAFELAFSTEPAGTTAGTVLAPFTVSVEDQNGHVLLNNTSTVTLSGPSSLAGVLQATAVNGVATFSGVDFTSQGSFIITASSGTLNSATSTPVVITNGISSTVGNPGYTITGPIGAQTLDVTGAITLTADLSAQLSNYTLKIENGGSVTLDASQNVGQVQILGAGTLDIQGNSLTINYAAGADPAATMRGYLKSAYSGGLWVGTGLTSSTVAAEIVSAIKNPGSGVYAIGYLDGSVDIGQTVAVGNQLVVKPSIVGDTDLNGDTNFFDLGRTAQNLGAINADWYHGDFNYDGSVNFLDIGLLAQNLNKTTINTPLEAQVAAVPAGAVIANLAIGQAVPTAPAASNPLDFGDDPIFGVWTVPAASANQLFADGKLEDVLA